MRGHIIKGWIGQTLIKMRKEYQSKAAKYTKIFRNTVLQGLIVRYLIVLCFIVMCTWSFYGMRTIEAINYNIIKLLISDDTSLPAFVMESFVEGKSYTTFIMADPAGNLVRAAWKWGQRRIASVVVYNTSTATSAENGEHIGQFKRFKCNSSYRKTIFPALLYLDENLRSWKTQNLNSGWNVAETQGKVWRQKRS